MKLILGIKVELEVACLKFSFPNNTEMSIRSSYCTLRVDQEVRLSMKSQALVFRYQNSGHSQLPSETSFLSTLVSPCIQLSGLAEGPRWYSLKLDHKGLCIPSSDLTSLKAPVPLLLPRWALGLELFYYISKSILNSTFV